MCGIVGAIGSRNVVPILIDGLKRLEYRGYDSCGIALLEKSAVGYDAAGTAVSSSKLGRYRSTGRVEELEKDSAKAFSLIGIAHTRWATHGKPNTANAHPHFSNGTIAVVHNGIIENHEELRAELIAKGYIFTSQTDTEVIAHLIADTYREVPSISKTVRIILPRLKGAYAIGVVSAKEPGLLVAARHGSPLVLGVGDGEMYLASDALALVAYTDQIAYLEEGDVADINPGGWIISNDGMGVIRDVKTVTITKSTAELGNFQHYMQKEIFEQPLAIMNTIKDMQAISVDKLNGTKRVLILACGTSFYAGSVAKYWIEEYANLPCAIEVASEYRYRKSVPDPDTLVVCISQSGETADTIAALKHAKAQGMTRTLTVCNVATSAMVRECSMSLITKAGAEIGVASTKAFTTQLVALHYLTQMLAIVNVPNYNPLPTAPAVSALPEAVQSVLALEPQIIAWADKFVGKTSALFLGRGSHFPIALEGALKLKEISYIHAEAYSAGELKHGPLALVDENMPVVIIAPNDEMLDKLKSNMQEVSARDGVLFVLADEGTGIVAEEGINVIHMPAHHGVLSPILHVVALQLLAYHTSVKLGNDVDKPRNLAKSVTVE